eukprot:jgi/Chlat1/5148/Chrsp33S05031
MGWGGDGRLRVILKALCVKLDAFCTTAMHQSPCKDMAVRIDGPALALEDVTNLLAPKDPFQGKIEYKALSHA